MEIVIRPLAAADSFEELTALLHRAYADLAHRGLNYMASYQDVFTTRERASAGQCLVAEVAGVVVGTVTLRSAARTRGCAYYDRADVASFGQFGVEPELHGAGIGSRLLAHVEAAARLDGVPHLALDTAEPATDLIGWYTRRGYQHVGYADWRPVTNYRSVILSKGLVPSAS